MITQHDHHAHVPENLRNQLAITVRSVKWSYAIFWTLSATQQGVLEWGEGYYNGDIKTKKTAQSKDLDAHRLGLQRSEQLRKLYELLLIGDSEFGARRPSGLSLEELSNLEWYYLVCMSFTFEVGQSLPGKALATGEDIWLCDAQSAESKVFTRSLLAKSASIQTVICFPHMGGVIELGVTDLVPEDSNLIQHIKTTLLELEKPICSEKQSSAPCNADYVKDHIGANVNGDEVEVVDTTPLLNFYPSREEMKFDKKIQQGLHRSVSEDFNIDAPDDSSVNGCDHTEELFMFDGTTSPYHNGHLTEDNLSQFFQDSTAFHSYFSHALGSQEKPIYCENTGKLDLEEHQDWSNTNLISQGLSTYNDNHYSKTLSVIQKSLDHSVEDQDKSVCGCRSSFKQWKKECTVADSTTQVSQRILKTILFRVPLMHAYSTTKSPNEDKKKADPLRPQTYDQYTLHSNSEKMAGDKLFCTDRKRESEQYLAFGSMVPSVTKTNESSILTDTKENLKDVEAKVDELGSCTDLEGRSMMKELYMLENTFDNHASVTDDQKPWASKRKASEIDETNPDLKKALQTDLQALDVEVNIVEQEVLIKVTCPWREYLLIDIIEVLTNLSLDTHTVHSSTLNGILCLSLKSKFQGGLFATEGTIKQALENLLENTEQGNQS